MSREYSPDAERIEDITPRIDQFIQANVGEIVQVFHELESDDLHIDIHHGRSRGDVRYQWLLTSGMSRKAMNVPPQSGANPSAELVICLPADWPLNAEAFTKEDNFWPVRLLKMLARYPHINNTWLYGGHSVPFGKPFASNTQMSSVVLVEPRLLSTDPVLRVGGREVLLWGVCPMYEEESAYKQANGFNELAKLFREHGVTELLNPVRASVLGPKR